MKRPLFFSCLIILTLILVACGNTVVSTTNSNPSDTLPTNTQPTTIPFTTASGTFHEYPLPQLNSGLMRPAIDHEGRIWFGEMNLNHLAVFDPGTQTFQQMVPPGGRFGIMGVEVAPDDTIWFAEQDANYIGHYFPKTRQYRVYALPTLTIADPTNAGKTISLPSAPNDLAFDAQGNVWFTELNADSLGKLDPHTGLTHQYPLSATKSVQKLDPYGITIDPQGMVWFTETTNEHIGRLNPSTGSIRLYTMQGSVNPLMEIASDASGTIWATSFSAGLLLKLNPNTGVFTPSYAPSTGNSAGGVYGLTISPDGEVWVTFPAANTIARFDVAKNRFIYYPIPTPASLPLGVVMGTNHTLWFTEGGSNKIGMLRP